MNMETQKALVKEEISIINALMAVGYCARSISFCGDGNFMIYGGLFSPGDSELLKSKEETLATYERNSRGKPKK